MELIVKDIENRSRITAVRLYNYEEKKKKILTRKKMKIFAGLSFWAGLS